MGKVLKADGSAGAAYVEKDFGSPPTTSWKVQFGILVPSTTFTALNAKEFTGEFVWANGDTGNDATLITARHADGTSDTFAGGVRNWWTDFAPTNPVASYPPDTWVTVELYWDGTDSNWTYDGAPLITAYPESIGMLLNIQVGAKSTNSVAGEFYYIKDVQVFDSSNALVFSDDFSSGDLSAWSSTTGAVSVVDDPTGGGGGGGGPEGFSLAISDPPLADPATWARVDTQAGYAMETISIKRGRTTERDKTSPGTATVTAKDVKGVLDPTNPSGPFYGDLDPVKQASVSLYNPVAGTWSYLFRGYVEAFENEPDQSEQWTVSMVTLTDMLDFLNDAEIVPDQAGNTVPGESVGDCFYTGQHIDDRLFAVLADAGTAFMGKFWPTSLLQIASGNVFVQGRVYANRTSLLQVIDEACDAEHPGATNRFVTSDGAFAFRGRYYRYAPAFFIPADNTTRVHGTRMLHWHVGDKGAFKADNTLAVFATHKAERSKTDLINNSIVSPVGISDAELASGTQFKTNGTSTADYGPRTAGMSLENLITDTADDGNTALQETASFAEAIVHNYKNPVDYVSELVFRNPGHADGDRTARWKLLCGVELSDLVTVTVTHPGGGGFDHVDHYVESIQYDLKALRGDEWDVMLTLGLSPRAHFDFMPASWQPPVSDLEASFTVASSDLDISCVDTSTPGPSGPITAWAWTFGDGGTSTLQNPAHTYASAGTYYIHLKVTGTAPDGTSSFSFPVAV